MPVQRSRNSPSREKNVLPPPHFVSISISGVAARNEPDCISSAWPVSSSTMISPGRAGAIVTSPACSASNVFMKKLSPPSTERFSPLSKPPFMPVSILIVSDMLTMAPVSAWIFSPASSETMPRA